MVTGLAGNLLQGSRSQNGLLFIRCEYFHMIIVQVD